MTDLGELVVKFQADLSGLQRGTQQAQDTVSNAGAAIGKLAAAGLLIAGGAALAFGVSSVKAAADFQSGMTSLVTGAGEAQGAIKKVSDGILDLAVQTGTPTQQLVAGMYMIDSAGYTAANGGLTVLKVAAEGAKVGNADLGTVADALTTVLKNYHLSAGQAAATMNQLVTTVASGKMHMQDLASSLSAVLPQAAAAHISFAQIGGAIATMTAQGVSAQQATQDLANTIRALQNPNAQAVAEMQAMGLNANQVSLQIGKQGLTGTLAELTQAITSHMGPSGLVVMSTFQNAKVAAADANQMIAAMPPNLRAVAEAYLQGSISTKTWTKDLSGLDPITKKMMSQFATTADKTHEFNKLLTSGSPAAQTYSAALSKMLGGSTGLGVALHLTGANLATFQQNVNALSQAASKGGSSVQGWAQVQQDFNQKLDQAKEAFEVLQIKVGSAFLPVLGKLATQLTPLLTGFADWLTKSGALSTAASALGNGISGLIGAISAVVGFFNKWRPEILVVAGAITAFFIPAMISSGVQATVNAAKVTASFITSLVKTGVEGYQAAGKLLTSYIPALVTSGAQAVASAAKVTASFIATMVKTGAEAVASAAKVVASFVASMVTAGVQAVASAAKIVASFVVSLITTGAQAVITGAALLVSLVPALLATAGAALLAAAPFILIGLIVAAVVVGIILAIQHWGAIMDWLKGVWQAFSTWFQSLLQQITIFFINAWNGVKAFFQEVWNFLVNAAKIGLAILLIAITGPFGLIALWVITHWTQVRLWFDAFWWNLQIRFQQGIAFVKGILQGAQTDLYNFFIAPFANAWTFLQKFFGNIGQLFDDLTSGHFSSLLADVQALGIPGFANGVQNFSGGLAVVGERGPELVSLPRGASVFPLTGGASSAARASASSGTGTTTVILQLDGQTLAQVVAPHLDSMVRAKFGPRARVGA